MSQPPAGGSIRAILCFGHPKDPAGAANIELFDTVGAALVAGARRVRSTNDADHGPTIRVAIDLVEVEPAIGRLASGIPDRSTALLGAARPGQILVSGAAASLLAEPPDAVALADLGSHRFLGLRGPLAVFEVEADGLVSAPIRTIETVARSVPHAPTPLIGRKELLAELVECVRAERVVTLTGSGGSGKTRLAIETALANTAAFDAIQWVELSSVGAETELVDELAGLVGAHHRSASGRRLALAETLGQGAQLLVLDNAEHLIEAVAGLVVELAERCGDLNVLVTSREPMGLRAEVVRRIPPLAVATEATPERVAESAAGEFLLDRLHRAGVVPQRDEAMFAAIHRICVRLDGIPLALELAAARAATTPLENLAAGLDNRFRVLSATRRDAQPHQRTLEASIRWSYDLLDDNEQALFRRLAAFSGSFDPTDVVAIDGGEARIVTNLFDRLVERSLVAPISEGRLRLLETVRAFAEDRLDESGETSPVRNRHLTWVRAQAALLAPGFDGPEPAIAAASARRLLNDARAAIHHAEQTRQPNAIWELIDHLSPLCFYDGLIDEGLAWAASAAAIDDGAHPEAMASGLVATALLATSRGDHDEIIEALDRAMAASELAGDRRSQARAVLLRAAHHTWHRPGEALPALIESTELCAANGDPSWAAWGNCGVALALTFLGRPAEALAHLDAADAAAATLQSQRLALDADARRCICEFQLGRWGDARRTIDRGRRLAEGFTSISVTACFDAVDAWLAIAAGNLSPAREAMEQAIDRHLRAGELQFIPLFADARAQAMIDMGAASDAIESLTTLREHPGVEWSSVYRHWLDRTLAQAHLANGDVESAHAIADRLIADATEIGNHFDAARGDLLIARLDRLDGELRRAEARAANALDTLWQLAAVPAVLDALDLASNADAARGRPERAATIAAGVADARRDLLEGVTPDTSDLVEMARRGRGERRRPTFGWDSLTPTELAVTELVAEGLTNPQIAERLIVGRATVKTHVSNVLRKLGVTGRTQLATAYRERESTPP